MQKSEHVINDDNNFLSKKLKVVPFSFFFLQKGNNNNVSIGLKNLGMVISIISTL